MEIQQLKFFLTVAREGNLTKASKKLNTVQSNTTVKLKQLEEELGHKLFIRSKKGMELTERGLALLPYAKSMLELEVDIKRDMLNEPEPIGTLSIGSLDTFIRICLRPVISLYVKKYPKVNLQIQTGFNNSLLGKLREGIIDFAGVVGESSFKELEVVFSRKEKMVLLGDKNADQDLPLLILGKECFFGQTLQEYFNHSRKVLNIASIESILTCVESGIGLTLLPESIVPRGYKNLIQKKLREKCTYSLLRKQRRPWSASEKVLVDLINRQAK